MARTVARAINGLLILNFARIVSLALLFFFSLVKEKYIFNLLKTNINIYFFPTLHMIIIMIPLIFFR